MEHLLMNHDLLETSNRFLYIDVTDEGLEVTLQDGPPYGPEFCEPLGYADMTGATEGDR